LSRVIKKIVFTKGGHDSFQAKISTPIDRTQTPTVRHAERER
jgi:hypothetical protein